MPLIPLLVFSYALAFLVAFLFSLLSLMIKIIDGVVKSLQMRLERTRGLLLILRKILQMLTSNRRHLHLVVNIQTSLGSGKGQRFMMKWR